jgi:hypothetical protein
MRATRIATVSPTASRLARLPIEGSAADTMNDNSELLRLQKLGLRRRRLVTRIIVPLLWGFGLLLGYLYSWWWLFILWGVGGNVLSEYFARKRESMGCDELLRLRQRGLRRSRRFVSIAVPVAWGMGLLLGDLYTWWWLAFLGPLGWLWIIGYVGRRKELRRGAAGHSERQEQ